MTHTTSLCALAALLTVAGVASAADLIPRAVLFGNPDRAGVTVSPDGTRLAYLAPVDGVMNVWVAPADDLAAARPVTADKKRGIRVYEWTYSPDYLIYQQDAGGNENFHLYRVHTRTGEATDLTPGENVRAGIQEISSRTPNEILVTTNERDPKFFDVYRVNLTSGEKTLVEKNEKFTGFVTDDALSVRLASAFTPDGGVALYRKNGQAWEEWQKVPQADTLTTRPAGFDESGKVLYMLDSRDADTAGLFTVSLDDNSKKIVHRSEAADVSGVLAHPKTNALQAVSVAAGRTEWTFLDAAVKADFDELKKVADGEVNVLSRTLDDSVWIVGFLLSDGPTKYYRYDRAAKKATFLFSNRKSLEGLPLRPMETVTIPARDGLKLVSYLTRPADAKEAGPLVLLVHGGPWARDSYGLNAYHQFLANRGYSVLSVNFRGSTGFGKAHLNAGNREWAAKMHDDLLDAVQWAIDQKIADRKKVAIMGGSYGGYATLVGLTFTPDTFACGVDIVGPSNLMTLLATIPPYWAPVMQQFKDRVGDPTTDEGRKLLTERSPLSRVEYIRKPLLIGQGANDPRVKQAESDQIVQAMGKRGIPVTYVLFPDEGHGFARPENSLAFNAVVEAFLSRHLGGRFEPVGEAFKGSTIQVPAGADGVPGLPSEKPS